jgi:hypothetical protein
MSTRLFAAAVCGLALAALGFADEPKKDLKDLVKEIDLKGFSSKPKPGTVDKPTVIPTADGAAKAFPDDEVQARIKKEVDFGKQQLLFFSWAGSGGDKLEYTVEEGKKGPVVTFQFTAGRTRDLRGHVHLFALPADATWEVKSGR